MERRPLINQICTPSAVCALHWVSAWNHLLLPFDHGDVSAPMLKLCSCKPEKPIVMFMLFRHLSHASEICYGY